MKSVAELPFERRSRSWARDPYGVWRDVGAVVWRGERPEAEDIATRRAALGFAP